jgi:hypothetical protein
MRKSSLDHLEGSGRKHMKALGVKNALNSNCGLKSIIFGRNLKCGRPLGIYRKYGSSPLLWANHVVFR